MVFPVGKIQINSWPIIGFGARQTGVLFVDREDMAHRKSILDLMRERIAEGFFVINYPEGTTHKQATTIDFKTGAFKMAAECNYRVYPVALDYLEVDDAWVDDDTFIRHFLQCFAKRTTEIKISFGQPFSGNKPDLLLQTSKNWIDDQLVQCREDWSSLPKCFRT